MTPFPQLHVSDQTDINKGKQIDGVAGDFSASIGNVYELFNDPWNFLKLNLLKSSGVAILGMYKTIKKRSVKRIENLCRQVYHYCFKNRYLRS